MTNHRMCLFCLCAFLGSAVTLNAAVVEITEPGFGFHDTFPAEARKHVNAVLHRKDCKFLGGTSWPSMTTLRYEGQTVPLNLLLRDLALCPRITLSVRFNNPENADYDWTVEQDGFQHDNLCVRINHKSSNIKIENLVVPDLKGPSLPVANAEIGPTGEQKKVVDQRVYSPKEIPVDRRVEASVPLPTGGFGGLMPVGFAVDEEVLKPFQGSWKLELCDSENQVMHAPQHEVQKWSWTVRGNQIWWDRQGETWLLTFTNDPNKARKEIDFTYLMGPFKGERCQGVYEWGGTDGKSLLISIQDPGAKVARPTKFAMSGESQSTLIVLRPAESLDPKQELTSLQGTWILKYGQTDAWPKPIGKGPNENGQGSERRWVIKENEITWISPEGEEVKASFAVDPQKTPRQIDLTFLSGPHKGEKCLGVWQWHRDDRKLLWLCLTDPGSKAERPTSISYSTGEGRSMIGLSLVTGP